MQLFDFQLRKMETNVFRIQQRVKSFAPFVTSQLSHLVHVIITLGFTHVVILAGYVVYLESNPIAFKLWHLSLKDLLENSKSVFDTKCRSIIS